MANFVVDSFTDTAGTALTAHTGSVGATWAAITGSAAGSVPAINATNGLSPSSVTGNQLFYASGAPAAADYSVSLDYTWNGVAASNVNGPCGRVSTSAQTLYTFIDFHGTFANFVLYKYVAGTLTQVGNKATVNLNTSGIICRMTLEMIGTTLNGYVQRNTDSFWLTSAGAWQSTKVACCTATDTAITAAGKSGLWATYGGTSANNCVLDNFSAVDITTGVNVAPGAGTLALSGPASTVSQTGSVVVTPGAGSLALSGPTPSVNSSSTVTVTPDAGALTLSGAAPTVSVVTNAVPVTDANWKFSPYNWDTNGSAKIAVNGGAYFKLGFTGTSVSIALDVSSLVAASVSSAWYPSLRYSVDNGPQTDVQLTPSTTALGVSGLAAGTHSIEVLYLSGWWENIGGTAPDRWTNPDYCVKVGAATIDVGSASAAPAWLASNIFWAGDSISEGIRANNATVQPANQNAYESAPLFVAHALGAEIGNVSFGGQGFVSGFNSIPAFNSAYGNYYNGRSRLSGGVLSPVPDYVCIWQGANGSTSSGNVQTAIGNMRTVAPTARVFVLVPINGAARSAITAGVAAYLAANTAERRVHLIDLGTLWQVGFTGTASQQSVDGLHPRSNWNARIASAIAQRISAIAALKASTRTVTLTLTSDGTTPRGSLTGLAWSWFDQVRPDLHAVPADMGAGATTDGSGVLTLSVNTTLASGSTGWLVLSDSDGTLTQSPVAKTFAGPVAVS